MLFINKGFNTFIDLTGEIRKIGNPNLPGDWKVETARSAEQLKDEGYVCITGENKKRFKSRFLRLNPIIL